MDCIRHSTMHLFVLLKFLMCALFLKLFIICVIEELSVGCGGFRGLYRIFLRLSVGCGGFLKLSVEIPLLYFWRDLFLFVSLLQAVWACVSCLLLWHLLLLITAFENSSSYKRSLLLSQLSDVFYTTADY